MHHHKFAPSKCMISEKYLNANKIKKIRTDLTRKCEETHTSFIGGFTLMFDEESGQEIYFASGIPIEVKDCIEKSQNVNTSLNNYSSGSILWPYTGFIQGNLAGWRPISEIRIVEQLHHFGYNVDDFIDFFKYKTSNNIQSNA